MKSFPSAICAASYYFESVLNTSRAAVTVAATSSAVWAALNVVASPKQMDEGSLQRDMLPLLQDAARELRGLL